MDRTKEELQIILESLPPEDWEKPYIFSYDDEYRVVHTLIASKPGTGGLYSYDPDTGDFTPLNLP
jgi:hypothetical protein